jgi:DNA sulfur modification protein DndB
MLNGIEDRDQLSGVARAKNRAYETKTLSPGASKEFIEAGWTVDRENKKSVRLKRIKPRGKFIEDRVWTLFYKMGFSQMSGEGGAQLLLDPKNPDTPTSQIDLVAMDNEVAIAVECKSSEVPSKRPQFQQELGKHSLIRDRFVTAVRSQFEISHKRQVVLAMFLSNILLSENDRARAKEANIMLFGDDDLTYYESLASHLGPATRYLLLAEMLPGKQIPGLAIRIPAVKGRMGGFNCYTFSISPEYLLKISHVSHRSKGRASDLTTYQRMLNGSRLRKIRDYISEDGIFPTNIVLNFERNRLQFERIRQESSDDRGSGVCGWLDIKPAYKSAWIIDGQHRLYAYSGHERASKSRLSVLAFEGLEHAEEARLFVDINAKQKSVKQSLLQELYAQLHWNSDKPAVRVRAIISRAVQDLNDDGESPFFQRIQTADAGKDDLRCISLASMFGAIEKTEFFIVSTKKDEVIEYGPLWAGDDNDAILKRAKFILTKWFESIRLSAAEWWDKGAGEGGGLAMNDGVIACINVLRSVFQSMDEKRLIRLDNNDLFEVIKPHANTLGQYLGEMSERQRRAFRDYRGAQGQMIRTRNCQLAIRQRIPGFNPPGLDQYIENTKFQTNARAKEIIDRIERTLQRVVLEELQRECGKDEAGWWMLGIPKLVRLKVSQRFEEGGGTRGGKEYYFDLIDYSKIALDNWQLFEPILAFGKGKKEDRLSWLNFVNEKRNIVSHSSAGVTLTQEDFTQLEDYDKWLTAQTSDPGVERGETAIEPEPE